MLYPFIHNLHCTINISDILCIHQCKSVANVHLFIILVASYSFPKCSSCMELISIEVGCYTKLIQLHYIYKGKLKFLFNIIYAC